MGRLWAIALLFLCANSLADLKFQNTIPADLRSQILNDLSFVGSIQGNSTSPLHNQIFGSVTGASYTKFFNSRINFVGTSNCNDAKAIACVFSVMGPNKMWITPNYTKYSQPQIARLLVVFHEARHSENTQKHWSHSKCPSPFLDTDGKPIKSIWTGADLANEPACDKTPFGSYGSSLIMLKNISKYCTNCTAKVKTDAGIFALDQTKRIIDPKAFTAIKKDVFN